MIKKKKKINYGFIVLLCFISLLFIVFLVKNTQVNRMKSTLEKQSHAFQKKTIECFILEPQDISKLHQIKDNPEQLNQTAQEIAQKQWMKFEPEITSFLADETLIFNQGEAMQALIKNSILNQVIITGYQYEEQKSSLNWNLLGQIKIICPVQIKFTFDEDFKVSNYKAKYEQNYTRYFQSAISWENIDGQWKIIKSAPIFPDEFFNPQDIMY